MLYAILKSLLTPPGILILLLAAAFFLVRGVLGRMLLLVAASALALMSLPAVSALLMAPLEPYAALDPAGPAARQAQAILVLGAGRNTHGREYGEATVDAIGLQRLRYAAFLQRATGLPLYVSGGRLPNEKPPAVAELMANVLRNELGVPVAGVEAESRDTWENAAFSRAMLARNGISRILLVSSAWHLPRATEAMERAGLSVVPAPTAFASRTEGEEPPTLGDWLPSAPAFLASYYAIHEHLGRVWYRIRQWVQGDPAIA